MSASKGDQARQQHDRPAPRKRVRITRQGPRLRIEFPAAIIAQVEGGQLTVNAVARMFGIAFSTAVRELRRAGITEPLLHRRHFRVVELSSEILARYQNYELTTQGVADQLGISYPAAIRELRRAGVAVHPRGVRPGQQHPCPEWYAEAVRGYEGGESLTALARRFGLTSEGVRYALKRCGVQLRSRGRSRSVPKWDDQRSG